MKKISFVAAAFVVAVLFIQCSVGQKSTDRNSFSYVILGDMHFDKAEHHDIDYVTKKYPNDISQIKNYCRITKENLPGLMSAAKQTAVSQGASFWLQLGDFTEGLCGSEELDTKQKTDFIDFIKTRNLDRPFFVVKGNHDITGEGARSAYDKTILPWQEKELRMKLSAANASFVKDGARFVLLDCYAMNESLAWLENTLKSHKEKYLFVAVHQPIIPYNTRSNWHVYARKADEQKREKLLTLLARHNAIVLTAHLHKFHVLKRNVPGAGSIIQLSVSSVIDRPQMPVKFHLKGTEKYNGSLLDMEPGFALHTLEERKDNILQEMPYIKYFEYADMAGYGIISVDHKRGVTFDVYKNMETDKWQSFNLTEIMKN